MTKEDIIRIVNLACYEINGETMFWTFRDGGTKHIGYALLGLANAMTFNPEFTIATTDFTEKQKTLTEGDEIDG